MTFPQDAPARSEINVPVQVTYKDGTSAPGIATFTVAPTTAHTVQPEYEDKLVVPGEETKSTPTIKKEDENGEPTDETGELPEGSKFAIPEDFKAPEGYEVKIDENTGEITVTFPDKSKLNKDTVEEFEVPVTVEYLDGSKDNAKAKFELDTDGDGKPDSKDDDDDGDGISDKDEKEKGSNPKNKGSIPATPLEPGTKRPDWNDAETNPDKPIVIEKDPNSGDVPEGATVEVTDGPGTAELDKDGNIVVTPSEDAKPGDKIVVKVKDKDGNVIDEVTVTIVDPWKDATTNPGVPVEIEKDKSFEVPEGTTVEVTEGPGKAEIDDNGKITVTPSKDAKPDDKIVVEVKDPNGKVIDTVTVTIEEKKISSSERDGCTESLVGFGLPLLALIPLGIASQTAIPGLQNI